MRTERAPWHRLTQASSCANGCRSGLNKTWRQRMQLWLKSRGSNQKKQGCVQRRRPTEPQRLTWRVVVGPLQSEWKQWRDIKRKSLIKLPVELAIAKRVHSAIPFA